MKLQWLLLSVVLFVACKNKSAESASESSSMVSIDSSFIPFTYFPLKSFTSSESPEYLEIQQKIWSSDQDSALLLPASEIAKLVTPLYGLFRKNPEMSAVDEEYLKNYISYHPIAAWEDAKGERSYVISLSGDDFYQLMLFKSQAQELTAIKLIGGICAGPVLENDSIIVRCEKDDVAFESEQRIRIRKKFEAANTTNEATRFSDSGLVVLQLNGTKIDTLEKSGVLTLEQFFALHKLE